MFHVRLDDERLLWQMAVLLAVADDVFDGVLFCVVLFPARCLV